MRCFARREILGLVRRAASRSRCCAAIQAKALSRCSCATTTRGRSTPGCVVAADRGVRDRFLGGVRSARARVPEALKMFVSQERRRQATRTPARAPSNAPLDRAYAQPDLVHRHVARDPWATSRRPVVADRSRSGVAGGTGERPDDCDEFAGVEWLRYVRLESGGQEPDLVLSACVGRERDGGNLRHVRFAGAQAGD
jgi:hypothetical protein